MVESSIEEVYRSIGVSQADLDTLRSVKRVWQQAEKLRRAAENGDRPALQAYKDFLAKCLESARNMQTIESLEDIAAHNKAIDDFYLDEYIRLRIMDHESKRWPQPHQEWIEWCLPSVWKDYYGVVNRWVDQPTRQGYEDLKTSATKMLQAYVAAVQNN